MIKRAGLSKSRITAFEQRPKRLSQLQIFTARRLPRGRAPEEWEQ